jgi:hypothetical protein
MNRFFSRQQMLKLEGEVHDFAEMTANKMLASAGKGAFDVKEAFNCFTADVISQYAFGEPMGFIAQEGWEPSFATWVKSFFASAYMMRHNSLARKMANVLPFMANYLGEDIKQVFKVMNETIPEYIDKAVKNPENGRVFADIMGDAKSLTEEEKFRYNGEGFNFLLAGTETTAVRPSPLKSQNHTSAYTNVKQGHPNSIHLPRPRPPHPPLHPAILPRHNSQPLMAHPRKKHTPLVHPARMPAHDARRIPPLRTHRAPRRPALRLL